MRYDSGMGTLFMFCLEQIHWGEYVPTISEGEQLSVPRIYRKDNIMSRWQSLIIFNNPDTTPDFDIELSISI